MKILLTIFLLAVILTLEAQVKVKGYYRKNGTYVQPHYRSNPDGNPYNNWSFPGNTNPYTGKTATGNPDTYLKNYNNKNNNSSSDVWVDGYYKDDGTYVSGHFRSAPNGNPYDNWSYPGNTNPHAGKTATGNPNTYLKNYNNNSTSTSSYDNENDNNYNSSSNYSSTFYVTANSLNVRSGPSTDYSVLTTLTYGSSVHVIDDYNSSWKKVNISYYDYNSWTLKSATGYIFAAYLSSTNPFFSSTNNYRSNLQNNIDYDKVLSDFSNHMSYNNNSSNNNYKTDYNTIKSSSFHPYGTDMGKITFWTDCGTDGEIYIYLDEIFVGILTVYFKENTIPECGEFGTISITRSVGTYKIKALGTDFKWEGNISVEEDQCLLQKFSK